jgi:hypothetical protein
LFRIVESSHYPVALFTPEFVQLGTDDRKPRHRQISTPDHDAISQVFKRLTHRRKKDDKHVPRHHRR